MATSVFDNLMTEVAIPALESIFGVTAIHTNSDGEETEVTVMIKKDLVQVGDYGECMENRTMLEISKSANISIGDTFTIENEPTEDDPVPDPTIWRTTQLLYDDGYFQMFNVIEVTSI